MRRAKALRISRLRPLAWALRFRQPLVDHSSGSSSGPPSRGSCILACTRRRRRRRRDSSVGSSPPAAMMRRVVEVDEAGPAGFAWVDYFEDLPDEPEVARLL